MSEFVLIEVGRETYALPVDTVRRVAEVGEFAPIAGAPPAILGVTGALGELVPILDVARLLGAARTGQASRIVIAQECDRVAALAVDAVVGVEQISEAGEEVSSPHFAGAALRDGTLIGIVDVHALFDSLDPEASR